MNYQLNKLFQLCEDENIIIDYNNLPSGVSGLYVKQPGLPPIIGLDNSIKDNIEEMIMVLSEELGHHFTTSGDFIGPFFHYRDRILLNKIEEKATRWATEFLIPLEELKPLLNTVSISMDLISERLHLPARLIKKRFEYLSREHDFLEISESKYLVLTNYPNIFVYEKF